MILIALSPVIRFHDFLHTQLRRYSDTCGAGYAFGRLKPYAPGFSDRQNVSGGLRNRLQLPVTNTHRRFRVNNEKGETRCVLAFRNSIMQGAGRSEHLYTSSRRLEHIMPDAFLFPILPIYPLLRSDSPTLCCADTTKAHAALPALWWMEATLFLRPSEPA